jgi:hypothetical protein
MVLFLLLVTLINTLYKNNGGNMRVFRRNNSYVFWGALIVSVANFLFALKDQSLEGYMAAVILSGLAFLIAIIIYIGLKNLYPDIHVSTTLIKLGPKEILPDSIKRAEFKNKFITRDQSDGLTVLFEKVPKPNCYVLHVYFTQIGEELNIILSDYEKLEELINLLEEFYIYNSIIYEKEDLNIKRKNKLIQKS